MWTSALSFLSLYAIQGAFGATPVPLEDFRNNSNVVFFTGELRDLNTELTHLLQDDLCELESAGTQGCEYQPEARIPPIYLMLVNSEDFGDDQVTLMHEKELHIARWIHLDNDLFSTSVDQDVLSLFAWLHASLPTCFGDKHRSRFTYAHIYFKEADRSLDALQKNIQRKKQHFLTIFPEWDRPNTFAVYEEDQMQLRNDLLKAVHASAAQLPGCNANQLYSLEQDKQVPYLNPLTLSTHGKERNPTYAIELEQLPVGAHLVLYIGGSGVPIENLFNRLANCNIKEAEDRNMACFYGFGAQKSYIYLVHVPQVEAEYLNHLANAIHQDKLSVYGVYYLEDIAHGKTLSKQNVRKLDMIDQLFPTCFQKPGPQFSGRVMQTNIYQEEVDEQQEVLESEEASYERPRTRPGRAMKKLMGTGKALRKVGKRVGKMNRNVHIELPSVRKAWENFWVPQKAPTPFAALNYIVLDKSGEQPKALDQTIEAVTGAIDTAFPKWEFLASKLDKRLKKSNQVDVNPLQATLEALIYRGIVCRHRKIARAVKERTSPASARLEFFNANPFKLPQTLPKKSVSAIELSYIPAKSSLILFAGRFQDLNVHMINRLTRCDLQMYHVEAQNQLFGCPMHLQNQLVYLVPLPVADLDTSQVKLDMVYKQLTSVNFKVFGTFVLSREEFNGYWKGDLQVWKYFSDWFPTCFQGEESKESLYYIYANPDLDGKKREDKYTINKKHAKQLNTIFPRWSMQNGALIKSLTIVENALRIIVQNGKKATCFTAQMTPTANAFHPLYDWKFASGATKIASENPVAQTKLAHLKKGSSIIFVDAESHPKLMKTINDLTKCDLALNGRPEIAACEYRGLENERVYLVPIAALLDEKASFEAFHEAMEEKKFMVKGMIMLDYQPSDALLNHERTDLINEIFPKLFSRGNGVLHYFNMDPKGEHWDALQKKRRQIRSDYKTWTRVETNVETKGVRKVEAAVVELTKQEGSWSGGEIGERPGTFKAEQAARHERHPDQTKDEPPADEEQDEPEASSWMANLYKYAKAIGFGLMSVAGVLFACALF